MNRRRLRMPSGRIAAVSVLTISGLALAQCSDGDGNGTGGAGGTAAAGQGGDAGAVPVAGACGPIGPWGEWPPTDAPPRELVVLPPLYPKPDCGPGCRLVTTRYNASNTLPWEVRFSGRLLTTCPWAVDQGVIADLDSGLEYELAAPEPEPGSDSYSAALSGECLVQSFFFEEGDARRGYICETCLRKQATRGLHFSEGIPGTPGWSGVYTASENFAVHGGGPLLLWALDLRDGSKHTFATSSWLVSNISLAEPYIVLSEGDGEVHLIDVRDWSDTNVTNDPAIQWMAASDDKTIVWIDQRYHEGGTLEKPANQEVVAYDIATKTTTRLTFTDPVAKPSAKWDPDVEGDWVVWWDDRDSDVPNGGIGDVRNRLDIYGYNLKTKQEYHVLGNQAGTLPESVHGPHGMMPTSPRLHDGKLYVVGLYTVDGSIKNTLWEFDLPAP